jgi:hypothetical protein
MMRAVLPSLIFIIISICRSMASLCICISRSAVSICVRMSATASIAGGAAGAGATGTAGAGARGASMAGVGRARRRTGALPSSSVLESGYEGPLMKCHLSSPPEAQQMMRCLPSFAQTR